MRKPQNIVAEIYERGADSISRLEVMMMCIEEKAMQSSGGRFT